LERVILTCYVAPALTSHNKRCQYKKDGHGGYQQVALDKEGERKSHDCCVLLYWRILNVKM
jgi:hypothetical protein